MKRETKSAAGKQDGATMSVMEMGSLLGLKRTESYWLVKKNVFETGTVSGRLRVDRESFEKWYANQARYRKVNGEPPGRELKERSYSPQDIAALLGIDESCAYDLIGRCGLKTVEVGFRMRVPREEFEKWYAGQCHYRTGSDRVRDAAAESSSISMPQMAALLGVPRDMVYALLKSKKYARCLETVAIAGRRRVTKESFLRFLAMQDTYRLASEKDDGKEEAPPQPVEKILPDYLTLEEAASLAGMRRQAVTKFAERGCFTCIRSGRLVRIRRQDFQDWLRTRIREKETDGLSTALKGRDCQGDTRASQKTPHFDKEEDHGNHQETGEDLQRHLRL